MPIYEYRCKECNRITEYLIKHGEKEPENCNCENAGELVRIISQTSFALKGSGWYTTDYKKPEVKPSTTKDDETK